MLLYQYTTKSKKFTSKIFYNINQPDKEERSKEIIARLDDSLSSKIKILNYYLKNKLLISKLNNNTLSEPKILMIDFIVDYINKNNQIKNVISFGSGLCAIEYFIKLCLPDSKVFALDFNPVIVAKNKSYFTKIISHKFDFFSDKISSIFKKQDFSSGLGLFISSSYVMDNKKFVELFSDLNKQGLEIIIDFNSGYITNYQYFKEIIKSVFNFFNIKGIASEPNFDEITSFQGYSRSKGLLRKLYSESGYRVLKETKISTYDYVVILKKKKNN